LTIPGVANLLVVIDLEILKSCNQLPQIPVARNEVKNKCHNNQCNFFPATLSNAFIFDTFCEWYFHV